MKTFNIYIHLVAAIEAVKVGFSWPAFFFGSFWMLDRGLWGRAAFWLAGYSAAKLVATLADKVQPTDYLGVLHASILIALELIAGANGNRWWEKDLLRRGYSRAATITAPTPEEAICNYLDQSDVEPVRARSSYAVKEDHRDRKLSHQPKPAEQEPHSTASA